MNSKELKRMRTTFTVVLAAAFSNLAFSQVGINTVTPLTSLDVVARTNDGSSAEGILPPRLTGDQIKAADSRYSAQHAGVIVYITDPVSTPSTKTINVTSVGMYVFDGNVWVKMMQGDSRNFLTVSAGDIKNSVMSTDHAGWYALDGRDVSTLPDGAKATAQLLGFTANIPDARDRTLKTKADGEIPGSVGGDNFLWISQLNLPDITLPGTIQGIAQSAGSHTHGSPDGGFLLGGTLVNNGGAGGYQPDPNATAWGGIGMLTNTAAAGAHIHTVTGTASVPTGGAGKSMDNRSAYLVVNTFIYLGE
ncbi:hypothetical protein [Chryseobacterium hagamense]|nr:hypothetical protein [Chryseobacterium hagamense]